MADHVLKRALQFLERTLLDLGYDDAPVNGPTGNRVNVNYNDDSYRVSGRFGRDYYDSFGYSSRSKDSRRSHW